MGTPNAVGDWSSEMEVSAFRRLFLFATMSGISPNRYGLMLGPEKSQRYYCVPRGCCILRRVCAGKDWFHHNVGCYKMEVMTPVNMPDEGGIVVEFHMPPICSPVVRPGRPAEVAPVMSKQLFDSLLSSGMIDLKELSLIKGKAAWMAYLELHLPDPTFEEESMMETLMTVVLNSSGQLVCLYEPGGPVLAQTSAIQECVALTRQRTKELKEIIDEAISTMQID